jgi:hypothetical protein
MGVSLWRSVYISANVDFNGTPYKILERNAFYKGSSIEQELLTYRKVEATKRLDVDIYIKP